MFLCHLDEDIFEIVKNGTKTVEVRLYDEKRRKMKIEDELIFIKRPLGEEKLVTKITELKIYDNFNDLVKDYDIKDLYLDNITKDEFVKLLGRFYSDKEQEEYGVVAIEFRKVI